MTKQRNQTNSPWTPENVERAAHLWNQEVTAKEIARMMGDIFTFTALMDKARKTRHLFPIRTTHGPGRKFVFDMEAAAKLWNSGKSSREVAEAFGVKASYVRTVANKNRDLFVAKTAGGKRERPSRVSKELKEAASQVQHMPLPPSGTWKPIELDDYEKARLPGISMAENEGCKYPLTDIGPHCFCAAPKYQMKPYCAYHVVKCNPPGAGTMSERRAHKVG